MKRYILLTVTSFLLSGFVYAQDPATPSRIYNVVFDLTSKDTVDHKMAVRWLKEISAAEPSASLELVLYGQSLDMVTKGKSVVADEIAKLADNKNVSIRVCAIAMKKNNIEESQLLHGVQSVPDGIYEIISKQTQGYGYIKAAR